MLSWVSRAHAQQQVQRCDWLAAAAHHKSEAQRQPARLANTLKGTRASTMCGQSTSQRRLIGIVALHPPATANQQPQRCPCTLCLLHRVCLLQLATPPHPYQWSSRGHRQAASAAGVKLLALCVVTKGYNCHRNMTPPSATSHTRAARSTPVPAACMEHTPGSPGACCIDSHTSLQHLSRAPVRHTQHNLPPHPTCQTRAPSSVCIPNSAAGAAAP